LNAFNRTSSPIHQEINVKKTALFAAPLLLALGLPALAQEGEINIICSAQADWCNLMQTTFGKTSGIKVNMTIGRGVGTGHRRTREPQDRSLVWWHG
jgi:iron(III) transport system substrate-binding protein